MATSVSVKVLLLLFEDCNTLDVNGPLEIFDKAGFTIDIAAEASPTPTSEGAVLTPNKIMDKNLFDQLSSYDILVIPGGNPKPVEAKIAKPGAFADFIPAFLNLPAQADGPSGPNKRRTLLSVCTGALILASLGVFNSAPEQPPIYATTHWKAYTSLLDLCNKSAAESGNTPGVVLPARFVDNGPVPTPFQQGVSQVRMISSGGVSCCMDASLHVVKLLAGQDVAYDTAMLIDYAWRQTEGVVFNDESIYKPASQTETVGSRSGRYGN